MRFGPASGGGLGEERGEVALVKLPTDLQLVVLESDFGVVEELAAKRFETGQVRQGIQVVEGKAERFEGMVEAHEAKAGGDGAGGLKDDGGVGGGAEADVPDHEIVGCLRQALGDLKLADVEGLGFGGGADDGVKRFMVGQGADAVRAVGQSDDAIAGSGCHGGRSI